MPPSSTRHTKANRASALMPDMKVPIFFFQGADDLNTPTALASLFARTKFPSKRLNTGPDAGHLVVRFHDRLTSFLKREVRPVALEARPRL